MKKNDTAPISIAINGAGRIGRAVFRAYFSLSFDNVADVLLIPAIITLAFATAALIIKYSKFKFGPSNLTKN